MMAKLFGSYFPLLGTCNCLHAGASSLANGALSLWCTWLNELTTDQKLVFLCY